MTNLNHYDLKKAKKPGYFMKSLENQALGVSDNVIHDPARSAL